MQLWDTSSSSSSWRQGLEESPGNNRAGVIYQIFVEIQHFVVGLFPYTTDLYQLELVIPILRSQESIFMFFPSKNMKDTLNPFYFYHPDTAGNYQLLLLTKFLVITPLS